MLLSFTVWETIRTYNLLKISTGNNSLSKRTLNMFNKYGQILINIFLFFLNILIVRIKQQLFETSCDVNVPCHTGSSVVLAHTATEGKLL